MIISAMAERKVAEITLEVIAAHIPVSRHHHQRLIFGPPEALDRPLVPGDAAQLLAR